MRQRGLVRKVLLDFESSDVAKRLFDIVFASLALSVLFPFLVLIALVIKLTSPGPAFYRGERVGRRGKLFRVYKFRTMIADAETLGGWSTANDDPRITAVGRVLRKRKFDELPQLINVLEGDMSIVGPRPEVAYYVSMYNAEEREMLEVRPGMTDFASIWDSDEGSVLAGSADPDKAYEEKIRPGKIRRQLRYVRSRSLSLDVRIIFETVRVILSK